MTTVFADRPHFQVPIVRQAGEWQTSILMFGNIATDFSIQVRVHEANGRLLGTTRRRRVPYSGYCRLEISDVLAELDAGRQLIGNAVVMAENYLDGVGYVEYKPPHALRSGTHMVLGGAFRSPFLQTLRRLRHGVRVRGTVMYLPLTFVDESERYEIALHNLSEANRGATVQPRLSIRRADGETRRASVTIPANGTAFSDIADLFGDVKAWLGGNAGLLTVFDDDHFIHGYYLRVGRTFVCDHLHWG